MNNLERLTSFSVAGNSRWPWIYRLYHIQFEYLLRSLQALTWRCQVTEQGPLTAATLQVNSEILQNALWTWSQEGQTRPPALGQWRPPALARQLAVLALWGKGRMGGSSAETSWLDSALLCPESVQAQEQQAGQEKKMPQSFLLVPWTQQPSHMDELIPLKQIKTLLRIQVSLHLSSTMGHFTGSPIRELPAIRKQGGGWAQGQAKSRVPGHQYVFLGDAPLPKLGRGGWCPSPNTTQLDLLTWSASRNHAGRVAEGTSQQNFCHSFTDLGNSITKELSLSAVVYSCDLSDTRGRRITS